MPLENVEIVRAVLAANQDPAVVARAVSGEFDLGTGICTELPPYARVFTVRGGMLVRWRTFPGQAEAVKAAGLEE
jgi:hypothetical protein